jgi:peptide chain release factor 2
MQFFHYPEKIERLQHIEEALQDPNIWESPSCSQLSKERAQLNTLVQTFENLQGQLSEMLQLLELADADWSLLSGIDQECTKIAAILKQWEIKRLFRGENDLCNAYLCIQAGAGGTDSQDWAEMLLRMYMRWGERRNFKVELIEASQGEVAGIKSAKIKFEGHYAYGWLRTETGVHRLVRLSPFNANRRHTSFAAVSVMPEVDESIQIVIRDEDLRVDVYRARGAGGQHVNRTESAVRITHLPTGFVTQCESGRSQHQNRKQAMSQLEKKLYQHAVQQQNQIKQKLQKETQLSIEWGSQVRSYTADDSRVVDLRTRIKTENIQAVLNGDLDAFLIASLENEA